MSKFNVFIYNRILGLYYSAIGFAGIFSEKANLWHEGRRRVHYKLHKFSESAHGTRVWVHCASLGEFEQARPLIEKIRQEHPKYKIMLTFFSPSGYEVRKSYEKVDYVSYLPIDTHYDAKKFVTIMKPDLVIWVKYEFWYHFLRRMKVWGVPVILISSVFRPDQIFFKSYGSLHRKMLTYFKHIFVQNQESQALLSGLGVESEVCKDTRFDRVYSIYNQRKKFENAIAFKGDKKVIVVGSSWNDDADLIIEMINKDPFGGRVKYIIAPHEVTKDNISYYTGQLEKPKAIFSRITTANAHEYDVAILDTVGILSSIYQYGDIAYIGGGFNAGIHNVLEPAVFGMPIIFGPKYHKSEEAKAMLAHPEWQAAHTISDYDQLVETIQSLLDHEDKLQMGKEKTREYVMANKGGTDQIYDYLRDNNLLPEYTL